MKGFHPKRQVFFVYEEVIREEARQFVEFVLSEEVQKELPLNQWMFPATPVEMPEAYAYAVNAPLHVTLSQAEVSENLGLWLSEWEEIMY